MTPDQIKGKRWYYAGDASRYVTHISWVPRLGWPPWHALVHYVEKDRAYGPNPDPLQDGSTITLTTQRRKMISIEEFSFWAWGRGQTPPSKKAPPEPEDHRYFRDHPERVDELMEVSQKMGEISEDVTHPLPHASSLNTTLDFNPPRRRPKHSIFVLHLAAVAGHKEACHQAGKHIDIETFLIDRLQKTAYLEHQVEELKEQVTKWAVLLGWSPVTTQGIRPWVDERLRFVVQAYHQKRTKDASKEVVLLEGGNVPEDLQLVLDHSSAVVCPHCGGGPIPTGSFTEIDGEKTELEVMHECKEGCFRGSASRWPSWVEKEGAPDVP